MPNFCQPATSTAPSFVPNFCGGDPSTDEEHTFDFADMNSPRERTSDRSFEQNVFSNVVMNSPGRAFDFGFGNLNTGGFDGGALGSMGHMNPNNRVYCPHKKKDMKSYEIEVLLQILF